MTTEKLSECQMPVIRQNVSVSYFGTSKWSCSVLYSLSGRDSSFREKEVQVKISDISDKLNLPRPGVTRTVKEMEEKGYIKKTVSPEDGRIIYLSATEKGKKLSEKYNEKYFNELAPYLADISEEEADCMIAVIEKFYQVMCERRDKE